MTKRQIREEAKLILALCASNQVGTMVACDWLGIPHDSESNQLILDAFRVALPAWQRWMGQNRRPRPVYAECEAMLRTGWAP